MKSHILDLRPLGDRNNLRAAMRGVCTDSDRCQRRKFGGAQVQQTSARSRWTHGAERGRFGGFSGRNCGEPLSQ